MKRQINAYRGHGEIAVEGHNIKLGRGGIREIEFFVQTQQLIAGGRNPALARPRHAHDARQARRRPLDRRRRARRHEGGLSSSCARSSIGCRWSTTSRRTRCRPSARSSSASRAFSASRTATPSPRCCSAISTRCSAITSRLFEKAPGADQPALAFPADADDRETLDRLAELGFRAPLEASTHRAPLAGRRPSLAQGRGGARPSRRSWCRCCSSSWRAPTIPTPRWCCSIISSPICTARRGCCRCCGKTPI